MTPQPGLTIADHVLVRVAGLPFAALAPLQSTRVSIIASAVDRLSTRLGQQRNQLCERLYAVIREQADNRVRRDLLEVKRSVFNSRAPRRSGWLHELAPAFSGDLSLRDDLLNWEAAVRELEMLMREGDTASDVNWQAVMTHLARLWRDPAVRTGILFAQPQLYRDLEALVCTQTDGWKRDDKRTLRALLAYCCRMVTKTSPFSSFTGVAIGGFELRVSDSCQPNAPDQSSAFTLSTSVTQKIVSMLLTHKAIRQRLVLSVNETAQVCGGEVTFLARLKDPEAGDGAEALMFVPLNSAVRRILALVEKGASTIVEVIDELCESGAPRERVGTFIEQLIDCDLIRPLVGYEPNDVRALAALASCPELVADDTGRRVQGESRAVQHLVDSLGSAGVEEKAQNLAAIHRRLGRLYAELGEPGRIPDEQSVVHHNSFEGRQISIPGPLREVLAPLERFCGVLPLFNADFGAQEAVAAFFLDRYGRTGTSLSIFEFFREFCETGPDGPAENPFGRRVTTPRVRAMRDHCASFVRRFKQYAASTTSRVSIPGSFFEDWSRIAEQYLPPLACPSIACTGQVVQEVYSSGFVLNKVLPGYGTVLAHCASDSVVDSPRSWLASILRQTLARIEPRAEVVELIGSFGLDVPIRPPLTERHLVYPGEPASRNDPRAVSWSDLRITFDTTLGVPVLSLESTGQRVLPLHLGTLSPAYFPPLYRLMTCFGPAFSPGFPILELMEDSGSQEASRATRHYPRMCYDNLTLVRETWCVPPEEVPQEAKDSSLFIEFRRLRRWAQQLGLPRRVFLTPVRPREYLRGSLAGNHFRRVHKPFFIDWDDLASHQLFRRFTTVTGSTLTFSEMLPLPEQAVLVAGQQRCAAEHLFELYGRGGRP